MQITGTLFGVERSAGTFTPDDRPGETVEYDNVVFTLATDDYQVITCKVKTSDLGGVQLANGARFTVDIAMPKGLKFGVRSIVAADAAKVRAAG